MAEPLLDLRASTELTGRAEFSELLMLLNYAHRATFLFALYNTAGAREELTAAIRQTIAPTPVFTWTYSPEEPYPVSYLKHLTEEQQRARAVVFFFDLERGDEKAWKSLDHTREHLARHPHTLIFWVTPKGRVDAANKAPHFWAQRSLVFDFTIAQPERQAELRGQWAGSDLWIENFEDAEQQLRLFRGLLDEYRELADAPPAMLAELNGKVAWLLNYLGRREEALPFLEEQLALARQLGDQDLEAEALINLAQVERIRTGRGAAIVLLEQARTLNTSPQTRARVLENLAPHLVYEGRADESLVLLNQALALFQQVGAKLGQANVLKAIGDVQSFRDDKDAALASYDQALGLFQQVGAKLGQANVLRAIGDVQSFRKEMDAALASYDQALGLFQQVGAKLGQANVLTAIGDVQSFRDDKDAALASYNQALGLFQQVGAKLGQANVLRAIGDVQSFRDDKDAALASYDQALELFQQVGAKLGQANVLKAIGDVQSFRDDNDAALASYDQALGLYQQVEDKLGQANVLKAIGDVQSFRDDNDAALASYDQALGLYQQVGDKLGQANVRMSKSTMNEDAAEFEAAIRLYEEIGDTYSNARGKYYYGLMLLDAGETERGAQLLQEARAGYAKINFAPGVKDIDQQLAELSKQQK
jgi:tetratricopeptide (TPR) repeat protein